MFDKTFYQLQKVSNTKVYFQFGKWHFNFNFKWRFIYKVNAKPNRFDHILPHMINSISTFGWEYQKSDKLSSGRADFKKLKNSKNVQMKLFSLLAMKRPQWSASNTDKKEKKRKNGKSGKRGKVRVESQQQLAAVWRSHKHTHTKTHSTAN